MRCPGCEGQFKGTKGVLSHLKQTTDKICMNALRKILSVDSDSDSSSEFSDNIDAESEDLYPRAEN